MVFFISHEAMRKVKGQKYMVICFYVRFTKSYYWNYFHLGGGVNFLLTRDCENHISSHIGIREKMLHKVHPRTEVPNHRSLAQCWPVAHCEPDCPSGRVHKVAFAQVVHAQNPALPPPLLLPPVHGAKKVEDHCPRRQWNYQSCYSKAGSRTRT